MKNIYIVLLILIFATNINLFSNVHIGIGQTYPNIEAACPFIKPGDTVFVHKGNYNTYQYYNGLKGTKDKWIVVTPFNSETIEINGGWQFTSSEYIRIEKLNFKGNASYDNTLLHFDHAGDCSKLSNNIYLDSCSFSDVKSGNTIKFGGSSDFVVNNCRFIDNSSNFAGIALNESRRGIIRNSYFENIRTKAIQFKLGTFDVIVSANYFKNAGIDDSALKIGESGGKQYYCDDANTFHCKNIKIYSNIFDGGRTPFSIGLAENTAIINNTIINPTNFVLRILSDETDYFNRNHLIVNNIFYLDKSFYFNGSSNAQNIDFSSILIQNNLFYSVSKPTWKGPDPNGGDYDAEEIKGVIFNKNIIQNPLFVDESNFNYKLQNNSPALSSGQNVNEPTTDYYGKPFKAQRALGAIESDSIKNVINVLDVFVSLNTLELKVGDSSKLDATVYPSDADNTNIIWSSSDDKIAIVNSIGLVTAIAIGKANVIVRTVDGDFTDTCKVVVSDELSVENNNITFSIFPNPAKDFININLTNLELNSKVEIYNQLGEIVLTPLLTNKFLQDANNQIYVGNLSSGVYFIRIGNKTQMFIRN